MDLFLDKKQLIEHCWREREWLCRPPDLPGGGLIAAAIVVDPVCLCGVWY